MYEEQGLWPNRTLGSYLEQSARQAPESLAVVDGEVRLSYVELLRRTLRTAAAFRAAGVRRHDVVTVDLPNWWEALVVCQATLRLGAVVNPVIPIYRDREIDFILRQAKPKIVVIPHRFRGFDYVAMLERLTSSQTNGPTVLVVRAEGDLPKGFICFESFVEASLSKIVSDDVAEDSFEEPDVMDAADPNDVTLLLYTSGTTAEPKGVLHNHRTLAYENQSLIDLYGLQFSDTLFMASPVTHITGFLYGVLMPAMLGATSVLMDVWDPTAAMQLIERETCRVTVAASPFLQGLCDAYEQRSSRCSLTLFLCGGADVPSELVYHSRSILGTQVFRVYGSSEFPTFSAGSPSNDISVAAESDGMPIGPAECRLHDVTNGVGELLVRGPELFLGYYDGSLNADAFSDDGFFFTGDLASLDSSGALTIKGRKKDIILRNGENLSAREIEDLLYEHPSVKEVAVVAMPDARTGERACAFVVPTPGALPTLAELCAYLETARIAKQKLPEWLEIVDALPTTATGKVQKFVLRNRAKTLANGVSAIEEST
jgi:cyclohexanecarboxylate-CoA ligase